MSTNVNYYQTTQPFSGKATLSVMLTLGLSNGRSTHGSSDGNTLGSSVGNTLGSVDSRTSKAISVFRVDLRVILLQYL